MSSFCKLCMIIFVVTNYCFAKDSLEKIQLTFKPDCFIDKNFIQLQGLATISDHKNFIYLQCKGNDCKFTEINLRNNEVNGLSVSHLNFKATKISNLKNVWKLTWDRDDGQGDFWEIEWDKKLGKVLMKLKFKKDPPFRPKEQIDITKLDCKKD